MSALVNGDEDQIHHQERTRAPRCLEKEQRVEGAGENRHGQRDGPPILLQHFEMRKPFYP